MDLTKQCFEKGEMFAFKERGNLFNLNLAESLETIKCEEMPS